MTQLETKMCKAIGTYPNDLTRSMAKACAAIAIEEIRKAFEAGMEYEATAMTDIDNYLSENKLIENR